MKPLPKEIFITNESPEEDGGYYAVNLTPEDAVSNSELDAPLVGTYKLVEENTLELVRTTKIRKVKGAK